MDYLLTISTTAKVFKLQNQINIHVNKQINYDGCWELLHHIFATLRFIYIYLYIIIQLLTIEALDMM